jgi:hypothetical protein
LGTDVIGGGAYVFTTGVNLSKCFNPFVVYANVWYSMQTAFTNRGVDDEGIAINIRNYPRDFVTVNLAAEYAITQKWVALMEVVSIWDGGRLLGHKSNVLPGALLSVIPGIEYMATEKLAFALGCQVDFIGENTTTNLDLTLAFLHHFEQIRYAHGQTQGLWGAVRERKNRSLGHAPGNQGPGQLCLENQLCLEKTGYLRLLF